LTASLRSRIGKAFLVIALGACYVALDNGSERKVDPTFLHRNLANVVEKKSDLTTATCHYKPVFGEGDPDTSVVKSVTRFGEAIVDPNGACTTVQYPEEDQIYVVIDGNGSAKYGNADVQLKKEDYIYFPASVPHNLTNQSGTPLLVIVMGFHIEDVPKAPRPAQPLKANIEDVPTQPVSGHPSSTLYRLLLGDIESKRDRIAAGRAVTSLFLMEIAPTGTNFPHHHEREEEIYLVLDGRGDMVAGGGMDGIEGRRPAAAGDAYFFRLNCTVGFYSAPGVKSRILAVRSWYPGMFQAGMEH
jgi:mannose-6-phosphate isomerase-like protein (cupin superfamily)